MHRRRFLQGMGSGLGASMFSWSGLMTPKVFAEIAKQQQKRCILLWLCGAPSQFETWDPKPGRITSGPFGSIPTKLPGVHFSELMPQCASIADQLAIIRSMKTEPTEHFQAIDLPQSWSSPQTAFRASYPGQRFGGTTGGSLKAPSLTSFFWTPARRQ